MVVDFIRHAESIGNVSEGTGEPVPVGRVYDELSAYGMAQGQMLRDVLPVKAFTEIFCSPYNRTMQTIAPTLERHGRKATIITPLSEVCRFEGKPEAREPWKTTRANPISPVKEQAHLFLGFGGEINDVAHPAQVMSQVDSLIKWLEMLDQDGRYLCVTHGNILSKLLEVWTGAGCDFAFSNCGLTKVRCSGDTMRLVFVNRRTV